MSIKTFTNILQIENKKYRVKLIEPEINHAALVSHYVVTKNNNYKKEAIKATKNILLKEYPEENNINELLEEALQQWLFEFNNVPFPPVKNPNFTFIDLFAGIGGFRLALQNLKGECVFSSEWNENAQRTYFINFGEYPFGDITKETTKNFIPKKFDVLCAGFPCQPFSLAGVSARNYLGKEHGFNDSNQGNLFFDILEIAEKHQPKVLFLENVKNLKSHDGGKTFATIERMIKDIGYSFSSKVINSQTEVPQRRERTYMVCFKDPKIEFEFPSFEGEAKRLGDFLEKNVSEEFTISDNLWSGHLKRSQRNKDRGTGFTVNLANLNKPANTLVARYYKDGKECLIPQENSNPRMLTPRECARLQGYPENFRCHTTKTEAYKQFGNSVSVPVIEKIAKEIIKYL